MSDDLADSLSQSPHLRTLVGLMQSRDVRVLFTQSESPHGVPWAAIVVQGPDEVGLLEQVARLVAERLDSLRAARRDEAAGN